MAYDSSGDREQALAYYERCFQLSRAAGKVRTEANRRNLLADLYLKQGRYKEAAELLQKALNFYQTTGDLRGQTIALNTYGKVLLHSSQTPRALDSFHQALKLSEEVGEQGVLLDSLYNLARTNVALDHPEAGLAFIERSLNIIEGLRANVESPDFKASYFSEVQKHYQLGMEILMRMERLRPGEGFATKAFLLSDRGRARLLFDLINGSHASLRDGADKELLALERELRELFRIQAEYRLSLSKSDSAELAKVDKELAQLRADYQEVQAQLRKQNPRLFSPEQFVPLTLQQFQDQLDSDTIMLQYGLAGEHSYLWVVTSDSIHTYELPPGDILEDAVHEYYEAITARQGSDGKVDYQANVQAADEVIPDKAAKLSQMLFGPAAEHLKNRRLLVISEGALQYLPIQSLPVPVAAGANASAETKTYLVETNEIVALPSASTLIAIRRARKYTSAWDKLVAIIADPVFTPNDERVHSKSLSTSAAQAATHKPTGSPEAAESAEATGGFARLAHASEEADAIYAVAPWGSTMVAKGFDASRETVMSSDVGQYQILHFATHGILDTEYPELSGLILTSVERNGGKTNGFMALHDIYSLDLTTQVTVLSACQTALGKEMRGEGQIGLTHSFLSAGSKSVVASLWKVDDRATALLMAYFTRTCCRDV
jgi:CHAT domain-containing protein